MNTATTGFCARCGGALADNLVSEGQHRRRGCTSCGAIAYSNPKILVTTIVMSANGLLLCRRATAPQAGKWALPGGFMESGETMEEAAAREVQEETGVLVDVSALQLYGIAMLRDISEIYVGFVTTIADSPTPVCSSESSEVRFFREDELPWAELAYADIGVYLRDFFAEQRSGERVFHYGCIESSRVIGKAFLIQGIKEESRLRAGSR